MAGKKKKSFFESRGFKLGMKYLYGIGAAVVIIGALFKILHLPGANEMLIVGLGTEAAIFFVSAFAPLPHEEIHWQWHKVFPQLDPEREEEEDDEENALGEPVNPMAALAGGGGIGLSMPGDPKKLKEATDKLTPELFESLSTSIKGLKDGVDNLNEVTDISIATSEFGEKVKKASSSVEQLSQGYSLTANMLKQFSSSMEQVSGYQASIQNDVKAYGDALKTINKNMASLTNVYEVELQSAQQHINSINKFYGSISNVMQNLLETSKDTDSLRQEVSSLTKNMRSLNTVYGNMLTAMAGGVPAKS